MRAGPDALPSPAPTPTALPTSLSDASSSSAQRARAATDGYGRVRSPGVPVALFPCDALPLPPPIDQPLTAVRAQSGRLVRGWRRGCWLRPRAARVNVGIGLLGLLSNNATRAGGEGEGEARELQAKMTVGARHRQATRTQNQQQETRPAADASTFEKERGMMRLFEFNCPRLVQLSLRRRREDRWRR